MSQKFQNINNIHEIDFSDAFKFVNNEMKQKIIEKERIQNLNKEEKKKWLDTKKQEREKLKNFSSILLHLLHLLTHSSLSSILIEGVHSTMLRNDDVIETLS